MSRAAMQQALEAIESGASFNHLDDVVAPMLRAALAEPEQEPVAWMWRCKPFCNWPEWSVSLKRPVDSGRDGNKRTEGYEDVPLYTAPAPRKPLTMEQLHGIREHQRLLEELGPVWAPMLYYFCQSIERAHGIGGGA